jgi:predicted nucleic acid-binding protein
MPAVASRAGSSSTVERIVLDTNVLVSAFLNSSGAPAQVLTLLLAGDLTLLFDGRIMAEYAEVLQTLHLCAAGAWHGRGLVCYASSGKEGNRRLPEQILSDADPQLESPTALRAPVEVRPIREQPPGKTAAPSLRPADAGHLSGPARPVDPLSQIEERFVRDGDRERSRRHAPELLAKIDSVEANSMIRPPAFSLSKVVSVHVVYEARPRSK